jgi:hypothetical protein
MEIEKILRNEMKWTIGNSNDSWSLLSLHILKQ